MNVLAALTRWQQGNAKRNLQKIWIVVSANPLATVSEDYPSGQVFGLLMQVE
jgi:hypothetical protein